MLTLKMHITPINITGVAAANAQDQAEADRIMADLDTLGIGFDARGKWRHERDNKPLMPLNGTLLVLAVYAALAVLVLAVKYGPVIWRW